MRRERAQVCSKHLRPERNKASHADPADARSTAVAYKQRKCIDSRTDTASQSLAISNANRPHGLPTEFAALPSRPHLLASERFHALFHSLFKVLFNFPSLYLFAIGLVVIFSLRWRLPPTSPCTRKQGDSLVVFNPHRPPAIRGLHPPWHGASLRRTYASQPHGLEPPSRYSSKYRCRHSDSALGFSHFTRSYYGNPRWFLFLRLVICLSSAGNLV